VRSIVRAAGPWEYFVRKVRIGLPDQCWEWQGSVGNHGYGNWSYSLFGDKRKHTAHRATYALFNGSEASQQVNHRCGNRRCCNPGHLYDGSQKENNRDAKAHGTFSPPPRLEGEAHGMALLNAEQVAHIKWAVSAGRRGINQELAVHYGVHYSTISIIKRGVKWPGVRPVEPPPGHPVKQLVEHLEDLARKACLDKRRSGKPRLTDEEVAYAKWAIGSGGWGIMLELAAFFNVHWQTIGNIKRGQTRASVKPVEPPLEHAIRELKCLR
jgi:hypothetical protein